MPDENKETKTTETKNTETKQPDHAAAIADLQAQNKALLERLDKMAPVKQDDPGLKQKADEAAAAKLKSDNETKQLESSLRFTMGAPDWLKTHSSLLPKDIEGIFKAAEKEKYDNATQKADSIRAGIIQSFFALQSNVDLLTPGLKTVLDEYLKLTNTGKQERASNVFENVFEPAFEILKRVKKAELLNRAGGVQHSDAEKAYREKLAKGSRKHYMGEKQDA